MLETRNRPLGTDRQLIRIVKTTMRMGMLLSPEYPWVQYAPGHTMCEGRQAWLRFHMQPQSSVEIVKRRVIALVKEQWREIA